LDRRLDGAQSHSGSYGIEKIPGLQLRPRGSPASRYTGEGILVPYSGREGGKVRIQELQNEKSSVNCPVAYTFCDFRFAEEMTYRPFGTEAGDTLTCPAYTCGPRTVH
jgi:hypothetical protein